MKLLYLFLTLMNNKFIKNIDYPPCKNCVFYKPYDNFLNDFGSPLGKCKFFGNKDVVDDEISYDYADQCRRDDKKCGMEGKYFKEEENLAYKIFVHKIISYAPLGIPIMILVFSVILK